MHHLRAVEEFEDGRSHWIANAPAGQSVEWDAVIINDEPAERIAWETLPGADVRHAGSVQFRPAPNGRGTNVTVTLRYDPPVGQLGALVAKLFGEEPAQQVADDLQRFKDLMEIGKIATTRRQPSRRTARDGTIEHGHFLPEEPRDLDPRAMHEGRPGPTTLF